jgi:hypothetical protein
LQPVNNLRHADELIHKDIKPEEIWRRILGAVKAWSPERQDDQTIVALRCGTKR